MQHFVYILYSKNLDKFYIGETSNIENRLTQHHFKVYKNAFTSAASDWEIFHDINCVSKGQALKIEAHIKRMKSKKFIGNH